MRLALSEIDSFYDTPLGGFVADAVRLKLTQAWNDASGLRVAGFGYTAPFITALSGAQSLVAMVPEGTGARAFPAVPSVLVHDHLWPLPDASVDRLFVFHGLEEVAGPRRLLREAWRVLADDGLLILAVANRRSPWAMVETSPLAAGRPYSRRQLDELLTQSLFQPTAHASALHFPPLRQKALLPVARTWERLGEAMDGAFGRILPNLAGLNLVEARKATAVPIGGSKAEVFAPGRIFGTVRGLSGASRVQGRERTKSPPSASRFSRPGSSAEKPRGR